MTVDTQGLMLMSVSEIARLKGVSKEAISKRVKNFEALGQLNTEMRGAKKMVPLAVYDRLVNETTNLSQVRKQDDTASQVARRSTDEDPVYAQEQARRARYDADLKEIELKERIGEILLIRDVEHAMARCAEAMVRKLGQMASYAEAMAAAVAKGGVDGARTELKKLEIDMRTQLAESMTLLGSNAEQDAEAE